MSTFEITCPQQLIAEVARRAQVKRKNLDVVDVQEVLAVYSDIVHRELEQARSLAIQAKMAKNSERRLKRARS